MIAWKFAGAACWHSGLFALGATLWHVAAALGSPLPWQLLSLAVWLRLSVLYATSLLVLCAQRRLLSSSDVPPVHAPRLGLTGRTWAGLAASRCVLRNRKVADVADLLALYGACALSGACGVAAMAGPAAAAAAGDDDDLIDLKYSGGDDTFSGSGSGGGSGSGSGGSHWLWGYGAFLGILYAFVYLVRAHNVLSYPVVQRHRYFRIKQRMGAAACSALALPAAADAIWLAAAAPLLLTAWRGAAAASLPASAGDVLQALRAGVLCAFVWTCSANVLEVVFTEPVAFAGDDSRDPTGALLAALRHPDPLIQDWALRDLVAVAEGAPGTTGRLAAVFADETGAAGWAPLARYCIAELADLATVVSAAAALQGGTAGGGGTAPGSGGGGGGNAAPGVRWNRGAAARVGGAGAAGASARAAAREALLAEWRVRGRFFRCSWCLRALSGLAAASLTRDTFGVAQMSSPGLGDAAVALLAVAQVMQAHVRATASPQPASKRAPGGAAGPSVVVDPSALALLDVSRTAAYRVTTTFGPVIRGAVKEAAAAAAKAGAAGAGGAPEALEGFLRMEE